MTETLVEKTCTPCRGGIPPLTRDEAQHFQVQAPNWELGDNAHCIERTFRFRNFREALTFVQEIGDHARGMRLPQHVKGQAGSEYRMRNRSNAT